MAEQEQQKRASIVSSDQDVEDLGVKSAVAKETDELKDELDGILDEIDEVLEANAEEFVKSYIQKGGE